MNPWREPTPEEAQVISKQETKEIFIKGVSLLFLLAMFCPIPFVVACDSLLKGDWFWVIAGLLLSYGFAALFIWIFAKDARYYARVKKLDYQVFIGVCEKKWTTGRRPKEYHLQVILPDGHPYDVRTSVPTYRKTKPGSSIIVSNPRMSSISKSGMWGYIYR